MNIESALQHPSTPVMVRNTATNACMFVIVETLTLGKMKKEVSRSYANDDKTLNRQFQ